MTSCADVLKHLSDFLDRDLDEQLATAIEAHLTMCHRCSVLYDSLRKVVVIAADERTFEVPADYSERLHTFIDQHL